MKAVWYERTGEPAEVLKVVDLEIPTPGPLEVVLKMKAMPVNPADLATIRGLYRSPQKIPTVPGYEGLGEVVQIGSKVATLSVGMNVIIIGAKPAGWVNGSWQEYVCIAESSTLPIPSGVNPDDTPQFFNTILTPWVLVVNELNIGSGQTLLLTAAGSGVSKLIMKLAAIRKFSVIGVVRRPEQVNEIRALGAKHVICSSTEDVTQKTLEYTGLKGVDAVIDAVGGEISSKCFKSLAENGQMIIYGLLDLQRESHFDIRKMLFYNLRVKGFWAVGWWSHVDLKTRTESVNKCFDYIKQGVFRAEVQKVYPISQVKEAVLHAEKSGNSGRIMLGPG